MLKTGILNPDILNLLAKFRHTNTIAIADRGFPFWPQVPTVDISLVDDIPTVRQVLAALMPLCTVGTAWMAAEFEQQNSGDLWTEYQSLLGPISITKEPHFEFKKRVPSAIGLVRTGDTAPYGNIILESA